MIYIILNKTKFLQFQVISMWHLFIVIGSMGITFELTFRGMRKADSFRCLQCCRIRD